MSDDIKRHCERYEVRDDVELPARFELATVSPSLESGEKGVRPFL